jgi:NodT family efflux transporter outer membrane factor (OMF) lipoprotein
MNKLKQGPAVALGALALVLSACKVGPDYHRPDAPVPTAYQEADVGGVTWKPSAPQDAQDRGPWWKVYADPELDALEAQVNVSNQTVKEYEASYRQSLALLKEAQAALFPTLSVSAGAQRGGGGGGTASVSSTVGSGAGGTTHTEFTLEPSLSWSPDLWGTIRREVESRKAGVQVGKAQLVAAQLSAQGTLAADYFDLRATDSLRGILVQAVDLESKVVEITQNQVKSGTADAGDLASAQSQLLSAQANLVAVEQQRGTYEHAIAMLTGHLPSELSVPPAPLTSVVPVVPVGIPSTLLERNPTVAAAERQMQQENALIGVATGAYFPSLSLTALGGYAGNPISKLFNIGNRIWSLGASAGDTLFQGGEQVAAVKSARAVYDQYVAAYRQTVLTTFQSVEDQLLALRVLQQQAELQGQAVQAAQKAADIALNEFKAGTAPYITVLSDLQNLLSAQESALTIEQNRLVATVTLIGDLGGGWDASAL